MDLDYSKYTDDRWCPKSKCPPGETDCRKCVIPEDECSNYYNKYYKTILNDKNAPLNIHVGDINLELNDTGFIYHKMLIDFYVLCKVPIRYDQIDIQNVGIKGDGFEQSSGECPLKKTDKFCDKTTGINCNFSCPSDKPIKTYQILTDKRLNRGTGNCGCSTRVCVGSFSNTTCHDDITGVIGKLENTAVSYLGGELSNVLYAQGDQFRVDNVIGNNTIEGTVFCHFVLDIGSMGNQRSVILRKWINGFMATDKFNDTLKKIIGCYFYLYSSSYIFYKQIYSDNVFITNNIDIGNKNDMDASRIRRNICGELNYKNCNDFDLYMKRILKYPVPWCDKTNYKCYLDVYMDPNTFLDLVNTKTYAKMNQYIQDNVLSNFFQEKNFNMNRDNINPPTYQIIKCQMIRTKEGNFEASQKIFIDGPVDDLFGYNDWLQNQTEEYNWNDVSHKLYYDTTNLSDSSIFIPVFIITVEITSWHIILASYFFSNPMINDFKPTKYFCQDIISMQTNAQLLICNSCTILQQSSTDCYKYLNSYCDLTYTHPNIYILRLLWNNTLCSNSTQTQCKCFNNLLSPPKLHKMGDPISMCFDQFCTDTDLKTFEITDKFCVENCRTVYDWIHATDPTMRSQNPGELNSVRFNNLCPNVYKAKNKLNFNVLINGIIITILIILLFLYFKKKWWGISIGILSLGITIFLSLDLKMQAKCENIQDLNVPNKCYTSITNIALPYIQCDHIDCNCFSEGDCPINCTCASGLCIPKYSTSEFMKSEKKLKTRYNISVFISLILFIIVFLFYVNSYWNKYPNKIRIPIFIGCIFIIILGSYYLIRFQKYSVFVGSCIGEAPPVLCGNYDKNHIYITDSYVRNNIIFLSPIYTDTCVIINSNIIVQDEKNINLIQFNNDKFNGMYMILTKDLICMLDDWQTDIGITMDKKIKFNSSFTTTPYVFITLHTSKLMTAQINSISLTEFNYSIFSYEENEWKLITDDIEISWFAIGDGPNKNILIYEYGTTPEYTINYKNKYKETPVTIFSVNTKTNTELGLSNITTYNEQSVSYKTYIGDYLGKNWNDTTLDFNIETYYFIIGKKNK